MHDADVHAQEVKRKNVAKYIYMDIQNDISRILSSGLDRNVLWRGEAREFETDTTTPLPESTGERKSLDTLRRAE